MALGIAGLDHDDALYRLTEADLDPGREPAETLTYTYDPLGGVDRLGLQPPRYVPQGPPTFSERAAEVRDDALEFVQEYVVLTVATGGAGAVEAGGAAAAEALGLGRLGRWMARSSAGRWVARQSERAGRAVSDAWQAARNAASRALARMAPRATGGTASATRASSAAQGALLRAQLAAEEVAGARLPQAITGYTRHGLNQAISRDGVGVSTRAIADAFKNPTSIAGQSGGRFVLTGRDAVVVVNAEGKVVTIWATNSAGFRVVP